MNPAMSEAAIRDGVAGLACFALMFVMIWYASRPL